MSFRRTLIAAAIMLLTSAFITYLSKIDDRPLLKGLSEFPMQIGTWKGIPDRFEDNVYEVLEVDDSILANYRDHEQEHIQLYIGYYKSQREGEIIHSPKNCMPGSGWNILEDSTMTLDIENRNGRPVKINKLMLQKGSQRYISLYWYQGKGQVIASEYQQMFYLVFDAITQHRTDGALVRLLSPMTMANEGKIEDRLEDFSKKILSITREFIPD